jgi:hypothetical protein
MANETTAVVGTMQFALGCFISGLLLMVLFKYNRNKNSTGPVYPFVDIAFIAVMGVSMYFINAEIMKSRCGSASVSTVVTATVVPWVIMFGTIVAILHFLPGWKQPFSNTVGYVGALMADGHQKIIALVDDKSDMFKYILESPALLINQFSLLNFNDSISKVASTTDAAKIMKFRNIILLKEILAEMMWYLLVGFIIITTSYNIILNYKCTITNTSPPPPQSAPATRVYEVTE